MNFRQLEYFSAVAEAKSISLAARNLHVAQPPISRQLALLEDELGVCLFLRTNKGVELTEAGRSLYQQSQNLFQDMRTIVDSVRDINAGMRGLLKIGMIYSNISIALQYLKEFRAQYPQVELYVRLGSPGDLLEDLNKGDLHLLFLRSSSERGSGLHAGGRPGGGSAGAGDDPGAGPGPRSGFRSTGGSEGSPHVPAAQR